MGGNHSNTPFAGDQMPKHLLHLTGKLHHSLAVLHSMVRQWLFHYSYTYLRYCLWQPPLSSHRDFAACSGCLRLLIKSDVAEQDQCSCAPRAAVVLAGSFPSGGQRVVVDPTHQWLLGLPSSQGPEPRQTDFEEVACSQFSSTYSHFKQKTTAH